LLTEVESKQILDAYGMPTVPARIARSEDEAVRIAAELGPIIVLKLYSEMITHKTDVGGVKLNLRGETKSARHTARSNDLSAINAVRFSLLVAEQRWIKEIDINPLLLDDAAAGIGRKNCPA
jgi:acetyltransferase